MAKVGERVEQACDLKILIVEDQAILAMELEHVLTGHGCEVIGCAMDLPASLTLAEGQRPDLALVDLNLLDGLTGPTVAQALVRDHGCAVVFLTANPELIPEGFAGALGVLTKPFDDAAILGVVRFARTFIRERRVDQPPRRFRMAPWLKTPPEDLPRH
ncbi:response regulator [Brevundimonas sp. 2R-24]|uniref:Response regulator n=1 Tax=Peiella sedimenti TaxID=3061083 RepID=A0ABT8SL84_9CAUL|nr:response regulator [Caulobacteraceae bacterium XZ-24]